MKYQNYIAFYIFISSLFASSFLFAQQPLNQVNIVSFTVKNKLPADVNSWVSIPASILLVAQKMPTAQLKEVKLVLQIKQGGAKICGNTVQATATTDLFAVRNFSTSELVSLLSQCPKLTANTYTICAQFYNIDNYPISREFCKEFSVGDIIQSFNAPQNIAPTNEKIFEEALLKAPLTFRWTPVLPKPKDPVMYKLRVWQLMQGQTGTQAMKSNEPIVEKEVANINQAIVTNLISGPCKAPYLCEFVWNVQAFDKDEKPIGRNNGVSELYLFKIK